ncbi:MAG: peptidoglycan DD-metalloendopeptidase family protein [Paludibacteraceae bacterium]|nr:peptidoglycan DD-metalloendopeptidase family protein [Paludibacteraceae bacterium]MBP6284109.1 peptidoglycan DD-metalloendopeptidase family protein [Paludibacteraceae bacterium]
MPYSWIKLFLLLVITSLASNLLAVNSYDNIFHIEDPKENTKNLLLLNPSTEDDFSNFDDFDDFENFDEMSFNAPYNVWSNTAVNPYNVNLLNMKDTFQVDVKGYIHPLDHVQRVTSQFGPRRTRYHYGVDLKLNVGDTVRSSFDGMVRIAKIGRGYGYYVLVRHYNGLETVYGHLSKILVDTEQAVKAGEPIGLGGNTGRSTGPHLHFEVRYLGNPINPETLVSFETLKTKSPEYLVTAETFRYKLDSRTQPYGGQYGKYTIRRGDTLSTIARRKGTTVRKLCKLNNISPNSTLRVGRVLRIS